MYDFSSFYISHIIEFIQMYLKRSYESVFSFSVKFKHHFFETGRPHGSEAFSFWNALQTVFNSDPYFAKLREVYILRIVHLC